MSTTTFPNFAQNATLRYTGVLTDQTGAPIPGTSLTTLVLTVWAELPGNPLVAGIDHVNINNTGRGSIDANGNLIIVLVPGDMVIINTAGVAEVHDMLIEWTYNAGANGGNHVVRFTIQPVVRV